MYNRVVKVKEKCVGWRNIRIMNNIKILERLFVGIGKMIKPLQFLL